MGRLDGKTAIITGGASGIGEAACRLFAHEGAKVVIADINKSAGSALAKEITDRGDVAIFVELDVTSPESWQKGIRETLSRFGKLNIILNNAGISITKDIEATTVEDWDKTMAVDAAAVFYGMKYGIEAMKGNGEMCSIVNTSSYAGVVGESPYFAYCAAKGAVTVMTKAAALHCGEKRYQIRVNSIHPGYIKTAMAVDDAQQQGVTIEEYFSSVLWKHPIGHVGEPIDIAYGMLYLASDESKFVTGSSLCVDGGFLAQ